MNRTNYADWVVDLERKALRHTLVFLQLGVAHEPGREALTHTRFDVRPVGACGEGFDESSTRVIVVDHFEDLMSQAPQVTLGALREMIFASIDAGHQFILLSRAPRAAFPVVPGSSLLDDASFAHGPRDDMADYTQWPICRHNSSNPEEVLRTALTELGPDVCASIDRVIYECLLLGEEALDLFSARELEALDGAGLITLGEGRRWNFPRFLDPLKDALASVLADQVIPQSQLASVSRGMWQLERMIRRAIRGRATAAWGSTWRIQCLQGDLSKRVLGRAIDGGYRAANSIKLIRDPLEWLSLGELLELRSRTEIGNLGLSESHWRSFEQQIMPIRNRLAHMRTLHPGDSADVTKWLRVLDMKLTSQP